MIYMSQLFAVLLRKFSSTTSKNLAGYMSLTYSITGLLIILGLTGKHELASEVAIVQGAVLATFYVLSGDARHLILSDHKLANDVIFFRLICFIPLAIISYFMSTVTGHINETILYGLLLRKVTEWLAEVHVTELERVNVLWQGWFLQPIIFLLMIGQITFTNNLWFIWLWAISPIIFSFKFLLRATPHKFWHIGWENITSTAIIGFTGYLQRVLIVGLTGKEFSGMLFPGFAIGSFVGSMAANVAGPTLFRKGSFSNANFTKWLAVLFGLGGLIFLLAHTTPYQTVGISIMGGAFMIAAQKSRLTLLKYRHTLTLDLLLQLSLIFSIIAEYSILGMGGLMWFYIVGSLLACAFYSGNQIFEKQKKSWIRMAVALISLGLIFPIFFQMSGNVYNNELIAMVDSGGNIRTLPLPFSLFACFFGIIILGVDYQKSKPVILTISAMFVMLIISTIITNEGVAKLIILAQYMLPTVGLVLGVSVAYFDRQVFPKVVLIFLTIFVPAQLLMTWLQGQLALTHYMYIFSVYSHFQYVPLVITVLYGWCLVQLADTYPKWLFFLAPWLGLYVAAGNSIIALFGLIVLAISFALFYKQHKLISIIPVTIVLSIAGYFYLNSKLANDINQNINGNWICKSGLYNDGLNSPCKPGVFHGKLFDWDGNWLYGQDGKHQTSETTETFTNLLDRKKLASWYINDILKEPFSLIYGHPSPPPRNLASSAHNYYLDLIYNFGFFSCLPLFFLIIYTIINAYKQSDNDALILWLLVIVMYVVIIDNNLKVTLRQPYPGILTFFLWGCLIGRLKTNKQTSKQI